MKWAIDKEQTINRLEDAASYLEAKALIAMPGDGQMLFTGWAQAVKDALELLREEKQEEKSQE